MQIAVDERSEFLKLKGRITMNEGNAGTPLSETQQRTELWIGGVYAHSEREDDDQN